MIPSVPRKLAQVVKATLALLAMIAVLAGVPVGLARLAGWPLPTAVPALEEVSSTWQSGFSDSFWIKLLALVVWVAWAQLASALVLELVAVVRGRVPRNVAGLGWAQQVAARVVGAVVLSSSMLGATPHAGASDAHPVAVPAAILVGPGVTSPVAMTRTPPAGSAAHVVERGDTLSSIATEELGSPAAWPVLWAANQGREIDGRVFDDPNLILPGWDLVVPPPAVDVAAPAGAPVLIAPAVVTAVPAPAPAPAEVSQAAPALSAAPAAGPEAPAAVPAPAACAAQDAVAATSSAPSAPAAAAPSTSAPAPAAPSSRPDPASASQTPDPTSPARSVRAAAQPAEASGAPMGVVLGGLAGATLLATGLGGSLVVRRRQALRRAKPGAAVPAVVPAVAAAVASIGPVSDAVRLARLELALRALAGRLCRGGHDARPLAVRQSSERIEVVLDHPAPVTSPWLPGDDALRWVLLGAVPLAELTDDARSVAPPCPALVGVGTDGADEVYVDLEAVGALSIDGAGSTALARVLAATLACTPLAEQLHTVTVGLDLPRLGLHHVERAQDIGDARETAERLTAGLVDATPSTFGLRASAGHEAWEPVVVVLAGELADDPALPQLLALAQGGRGVAVIGGGLPGVRWRLTAASPAGEARLEPLGWVVQPHGITAGELAVLGSAVATAGELDALPVPPDPPVSPTGPQPASAAVDPGLLAPGSPHPTPWSLMVRVLGPVDVVDADGRGACFERARALELLVWLAQHRASATRTGARAAMWDTEISNASFANVVSEARRALARLVPPPEGDEWLARTYAEHLPLHRAVVLDADLVADALARARRLPPADAHAELRGALELIRGAPYAGCAYLWADAEALPSTLTLLATATTAELARCCLELDDVDGALAATAAGLAVLPGHEELVGLRMKAHAVRGDRRSVRREFSSYEQVVLADHWADEPAPELVALQRELLGAPVPVAGT